MAHAEMPIVSEGQSAPLFAAPNQNGEDVALTDFKGDIVVLYFYPKDDTSGCTKEAIAFSDLKDAFDRHGVIILGVSKDSVKKHARFVEKHALRITLISDEQSDICAHYGVWVEKSMYGRKYMGIERSTFLIDQQGVVQKVWRKVKVPGHADAVLTAVEELLKKHL